MKSFLSFTLLFTLLLCCSAIVVPISTNSERCMVIYSMSQEDTIKIALNFPTDARVEQFYDYALTVKNLAGSVVLQEQIRTASWRTEVTVPDQTIYEACISISANRSKQGNSSVVYRGQVLVNYEANTHFVPSAGGLPQKYQSIREEEISTLKTQANDLINITKHFLQLQRAQREEQRREYEEKRGEEDSLLGWWVVELAVIVLLGVVQWYRMKNRIQAKRD